MKILVTGAGGFIGGHLVGRLLREGHVVVGVDIKPLTEWHQFHSAALNRRFDLSQLQACHDVLDFHSFGHVYNLAADMGGMGFIEKNKAACMLSVLINTHLLKVAHVQGIKKYFYASSACVYAANKQKAKTGVPLRETDAYPAMPEDGYGWEKLFSERMCRHFSEDYGLKTRVARYHNVYGPYGTFQGGREKAPAAICRKVVEAILSGKHEIEIWGDGEQVRSFMYIDDCIEGTLKIMESGIEVPLNLGSSEAVTINQLVDVVEDIAGVKLKRKYNLEAPKGVNGRSSDNTLIRGLFNWEPSTRLRDGMERTYAWILEQMTK